MRHLLSSKLFLCLGLNFVFTMPLAAKTSIIDVLAVFDKTYHDKFAKNKNASLEPVDKDVLTHLEHFYNYTSQVYRLNGLDMVLRMEYRGIVNNTKTDQPEILIQEVYDATKGEYKRMKEYQKFEGFDHLTFMIYNYPRGSSTTCGVASTWTPHAIKTASQYDQFISTMAVNRSCNTGWTFAHELGHSMGLNHGPPVGPYEDDSMGFFRYAYGICEVGQFASIMSYTMNCRGSKQSQYYSNPEEYCTPGYKCGDKDRHDARRALREVREDFSNIRKRKNPPGGSNKGLLQQQLQDMQKQLQQIDATYKAIQARQQQYQKDIGTLTGELTRIRQDIQKISKEAIVNRQHAQALNKAIPGLFTLTQGWSLQPQALKTYQYFKAVNDNTPIPFKLRTHHIQIEAPFHAVVQVYPRQYTPQMKSMVLQPKPSLRISVTTINQVNQALHELERGNVVDLNTNYAKLKQQKTEKESQITALTNKNNKAKVNERDVKQQHDKLTSDIKRLEQQIANLP